MVQLAGVALMVLCAAAGMALSIWAFRNDRRQTRRAPYRQRGQETRSSARSGATIR